MLTTSEIAILGLAILSALAYLSLFLLDARRHTDGSRLLFIDFLLVVASVEVVADTLQFHALALLTQGALMASGLALALTVRSAK